MEHSSAAAVTVSNTVDTELIAYFADCKNYSENSRLKFWVTNANKYPLLAPLAGVYSGAGTRRSAVPANIFEPERRSGNIVYHSRNADTAAFRQISSGRGPVYYDLPKC